MLRGQNLCGGHQRRLIAVLDGHQHGLQGDNGLARAHIPLQQPAHGVGLAHVGDNLAQRPLLRPGGMKRQHLAQRFAHLVGGRKADAGALPHAAALQFQAQLQKEELLEDQPPVGRRRPALQLGKGRALGRKMRLAERHFAAGQIQPREHRLRQAFGHQAAHPFEQMEDHLALPARSQGRPAQRFVDRRNAAHLEQPRLGVGAGVGQDFKLRLDHLQIAAGARWLDPSVNGHRLPGMKLALQVAAVEPDALQRQPSLPDGQLEDGGLARLQQRRAAHLGDDRGHLAGLEFVQAARILPVLVTKRQVIEQVFGGQNALGGEQLRHARPHAAHVHHRSVEAGHTPDAKWLASGGQTRWKPVRIHRFQECWRWGSGFTRILPCLLIFQRLYWVCIRRQALGSRSAGSGNKLRPPAPWPRDPGAASGHRSGPPKEPGS